MYLKGYILYILRTSAFFGGGEGRGGLFSIVGVVGVVGVGIYLDGWMDGWKMIGMLMYKYLVRARL